jgi:hypothetical protein
VARLHQSGQWDVIENIKWLNDLAKKKASCQGAVAELREKETANPNLSVQERKKKVHLSMQERKKKVWLMCLH